MTVSTTRRLEDLRDECDRVKISYSTYDSREQLMDKLRAALGAFDLHTELDPMKAQETKSMIKLGPEGMDFSGIKHLLTDKYVAEPKYDGVRIRMFIGLTGSSINSSRRSVVDYKYKDRTGNYPQLAQVCGEDLTGIILDGELVSVTPKVMTGKTMTDSILTASCALNNSSPEKAVAAQKKYGFAEFYVFDVIGLSQTNPQTLSYNERRAILEHVVRRIQERFPDCNIKLVPQMPATEETIRQAMLDGFEGVVLKDRQSPYLCGKRKGWWKCKTFSTADAFIVDWIPGEGRNEGLVGSLELAIVVGELFSNISGLSLSEHEFAWDGQLCKKIAQVGNLTDEFRAEISAPDGSLKPEWNFRVIEFVGQLFTVKDQRVRHPHMIRLRPDKEWLDCDISQLDIFPRG